MPTYKVRDPSTGKTVTLRGESPPTEQELTEIFSQLGATSQSGEEAPAEAAPETDPLWPGVAGVQPPSFETPASHAGMGGREGFMKGLGGEDSTVVTGLSDIGNAFTAEHAGGMVRDAGSMLAGLAVPGVLKGMGSLVEGAGKLAGGGPSRLMMRSVIGNSIGGPAGAIAGAAGPAVLRGTGRGMQSVGRAMSEGAPARPSQPAPPPPQAAGATQPTAAPPARPMPQVSGMGNVTSPGPILSPRPGLSSAPPAQQGPLLLPEAPAPAPATAPTQPSGGAPLGSLPPGQSPRVTAWKPGFGPTAGDAATLRNAYGSKTAGSLLKTPQSQVKALTPEPTAGPLQLPSAIQQSLSREFFAQPTPELRQMYIDRAPNPLVRDFLTALQQQIDVAF